MADREVGAEFISAPSCFLMASRRSTGSLRSRMVVATRRGLAWTRAWVVTRLLGLLPHCTIPRQVWAVSVCCIVQTKWCWQDKAHS